MVKWREICSGGTRRDFGIRAKCCENVFDMILELRFFVDTKINFKM